MPEWLETPWLTVLRAGGRRGRFRAGCRARARAHARKHARRTCGWPPVSPSPRLPGSAYPPAAMQIPREQRAAAPRRRRARDRQLGARGPADPASAPAKRQGARESHGGRDGEVRLSCFGGAPRRDDEMWRGVPLPAHRRPGRGAVGPAPRRPAALWERQQRQQWRAPLAVGPGAAVEGARDRGARRRGRSRGRPVEGAAATGLSPSASSSLVREMPGAGRRQDRATCGAEPSRTVSDPGQTAGGSWMRQTRRETHPLESIGRPVAC